MIPEINRCYPFKTFDLLTSSVKFNSSNTYIVTNDDLELSNIIIHYTSKASDAFNIGFNIDQMTRNQIYTGTFLCSVSNQLSSATITLKNNYNGSVITTIGMMPTLFSNVLINYRIKTADNNNVDLNYIAYPVQALTIYEF